MTLTSVAVQGPWLITVIVNSTSSDTLTTLCPYVTSFVISKSTIDSAVMFSMESLLFEIFVSLSMDVTRTSFAIVPFEMTFAIIVRFTGFPTFT